MMHNLTNGYTRTYFDL